MAELNENDPIIDVESLNERFEEKGYFRRLRLYGQPRLCFLLLFHLL